MTDTTCAMTCRNYLPGTHSIYCPDLATYYVWPNGDVWLAEEYDQVEDYERNTSDDFEVVEAVDETHALKLQAKL